MYIRYNILDFLQTEMGEGEGVRHEFTPYFRTERQLKIGKEGGREVGR